MPYKLTPQAEDDVISLLAFGAEQFGRIQALKYREGLERTLELISTHPQLGRQHRGDRRRFSFGSHIIFYQIQGEEILVLRIRHHSVDPENYL